MYEVGFPVGLGTGRSATSYVLHTHNLREYRHRVLIYWLDPTPYLCREIPLSAFAAMSRKSLVEELNVVCWFSSIDST